MKWNKMPVFQATFLHYEAWVGLGTAWVNKVKFDETYPKAVSIAQPSTLSPQGHGGPRCIAKKQTTSMVWSAGKRIML